MVKISILKVLFLSLLFLLLSQSCGYAQVMLTQEESMMLGHELAQAKNSILIAKEELKKSQSNLKASENELMNLRTELSELQQNLIVQKHLLKDANQYLTEQEKEHKKQMKKLSRQRNVAYVIAATFVYLAINK